MKLATRLTIESTSELQIIETALEIYAQRLIAGDPVPIIGRNNMHALDLVRTLQAEIGLKPQREPGEYTPITKDRLWPDEPPPRQPERLTMIQGQLAASEAANEQR